MEIILASNNENKVREIKKILNNVTILILKEIGFKGDIAETGTTFEENAFIKAKTIYDIYHKPVIADDSGLAVDALKGAPGIYSHRYAGEMCDDKLNNELLIKNLQGISQRNARYVTCLCYYDGCSPIYAHGTCEGVIVDNPQGSNGFGYDPHFFLPNLNKTMAELSIDEKNQISHRAKALAILQEKLNEVFANIR